MAPHAPPFRPSPPSPTITLSITVSLPPSPSPRAPFLAISAQDMAVFETPEGILASEHAAAQQGLYMGEVVANKNVRKAKGRYRDGSRAFADDDSEDEEPTPAPQAVRRPAPVAAAAAGGAKAGGAKDAAARQAEARQRKLEEEAATRAHVRELRRRVHLGLGALGRCVAGHRSFASQHLEEYLGLCMPFLSSKLGGGPAFEVVQLLGSCLPGRLGRKALALAASLRLVVMAANANDDGYSAR